MSESEIQAQCLEYLQRHPKVANVVRYNSGSFAMGGGGKYRRITCNSQTGHSDIGGVLQGGRALFCEIKRPGEIPTPEQDAFLNRMALAGAHAFWCDSLEGCIQMMAGV